MMSQDLKQFCERWVINTVAVMVAAQLVQGVRYEGFSGLLVASLLLGIFNSFLKPILMLFSFPFILVTLGLFMLVINAVLLYLVGSLVKTFHVDGFWPAFWGALVISLISHLANWFTGTSKIRIRATVPGASAHSQARGKPGEGPGPIIDV